MTNTLKKLQYNYKTEEGTGKKFFCVSAEEFFQKVLFEWVKRQILF